MAAPTTPSAPKLTPSFCFNRTALQALLPPHITQRRRRHNLSEPECPTIAESRRMGPAQHITKTTSPNRQTRHSCTRMHVLQAECLVSFVAGS
ncbi:hypothetical protein KCU64_g12179, partial [Aureobasidium melanogenum]